MIETLKSMAEASAAAKKMTDRELAEHTFLHLWTLNGQVYKTAAKCTRNERYIYSFIGLGGFGLVITIVKWVWG